VSATNGTLSGTLGVTGATTLSSTLGVSGASTLSTLSATSGSFSTTLGVTGAVTCSTTLDVTGATHLGTTYTGNQSITGTLAVSGVQTNTDTIQTPQLKITADSTKTSANIQADNTISQIYITGNGSSYHNWCITNRYGSGGLVFFPDGNYEDRMGIFASGSKAEWGPGSNEGTDLGTSGSRWNALYVKDITCDTVAISGTSTVRDVNPVTNTTYSLGTTSLRWLKIWCTDITSTNALVVSSDRRLKKNITPLDKQNHVDFVKTLKPVSFQYDPNKVKDCDADTHFGLIGQDVRASMECCFGTSANTSLLSTDSDGILGIRTTELVSSLLVAIQDLQARVDYLEKYRSSTIVYGGTIPNMDCPTTTPTTDPTLPANKKFKLS
jgi:hypothetical protein